MHIPTAQRLQSVDTGIGLEGQCGRAQIAGNLQCAATPVGGTRGKVEQAKTIRQGACPVADLPQRGPHVDAAQFHTESHILEPSVRQDKVA